MRLCCNYLAGQLHGQPIGTEAMHLRATTRTAREGEVCLAALPPGIATRTADICAAHFQSPFPPVHQTTGRGCSWPLPGQELVVASTRHTSYSRRSQAKVTSSLVVLYSTRMRRTAQHGTAISTRFFHCNRSQQPPHPADAANWILHHSACSISLRSDQLCFLVLCANFLASLSEDLRTTCRC
jgi:hypothetical protein